MRVQIRPSRASGAWRIVAQLGDQHPTIMRAGTQAPGTRGAHVSFPLCFLILGE